MIDQSTPRTSATPLTSPKPRNRPCTSTTTSDTPTTPPGPPATTRSEEKLNIGTEQVQTGKARLRKWIETENVQVDVPIRTEKAVLVTEPITDANRGDAHDGPDLSEEDHEVVLNSERPVLSTETIAKERVRLDTQVEESVQTVGGDVRKERIELDDDTTTPGGNRH